MHVAGLASADVFGCLCQAEFKDVTVLVDGLASFIGFGDFERDGLATNPTEHR
jgi:hypothetical protein